MLAQKVKVVEELEFTPLPLRHSPTVLSFVNISEKKQKIEKNSDMQILLWG